MTRTSIIQLFAFVLLGAAASAHAQSIIFISGFEPDTTLSSPQDCWTNSQQVGCWQTISGQDYSTGGVWPAPVWGSENTYGGGSVPLLIADVPGATSSNVGTYISNRIVTTQRHTQDWDNKAYYSEITEAKFGQNRMQDSISQDTFEFFPTSEQGDLYLSYWIRFQPGMVEGMSGLQTSVPGAYSDGGTWRVLFEFKTGTSATPGNFPGDDGDYRVAVYIMTGCSNDVINAHLNPCTNPDPNNPPQPYWAANGDNVAGGNYPLVNHWVETNTTVPVPDSGTWNKVEIFWHRSAGSDGRFWIAINGTPLINHLGPNMGGHLDQLGNPAPLPINRIFPANLYTGGRFPAYQWLDDIQVWTSFPFLGCTTETWCDPPYAPH